MLKRFKSKVVIASMLSLIFIILNNLEIINIDNVTVDAIIQAVITILVGFGILNNPTDKNHF